MKILRRDGELLKKTIENEVINTFVEEPTKNGEIVTKVIETEEFVKGMAITGKYYLKEF